jgi:NTE family protein
VAVSEAARLAEIADRLQLSVWPDRLGVVGVDSRSGKRVVWDKSSGVELLQAVAASCALPGVYPAVMIGQGQYCDGGVYSLENADVTEGYAKVLILKVGLPIATPFTLDDQVEFLRRSGSQVEVVEPDAEVVAVLRRTGGNALNPELRAPVAHAAWAQGQSLSKRLAAFWNGLSS